MRLLAIVTLLCAGRLAFATTCEPDMNGVSPSNSPQMTTYIRCSECRSAQDFAQDFVAHASNWVFYNSQGQAALAAYAGSGQGAPPLTFPMCSDHGQCVTLRVSIQWEYIDLPIPGIGPTTIPTVPSSITIRATDVGGNTRQEVFYTGPAPNPHFHVPTDSTDDTIPDGACRRSNGALIDGSDDSDNGGSGNGSGNDGPDDGSGSGGGPIGGAPPWGGGGGGVGNCTMRETEPGVWRIVCQVR